jgi:integrase
MTTDTIPRNLADEFCAKAKASDKDTYLKDSLTPGLVLRITPNGAKIWQLRYRARIGDSWASRRKGLGAFPTVTTAAARKAAASLKIDISRGHDPVEEKRKLAEQRAEEKRQREAEAARRITVTELFNRWEKVDLANRKDKGKEVRRMFEKDVLPYLGALAVEDVKKGHITEVTDVLLARGVNRMAKLIFSLMRQMFRFAVDRDFLEHDPSASIRKAKIGGKEVERDRVLSESEIQQLNLKLPNAGMQASSEAAIWIALSTCCRIGELLAARWEHVDLDEKIWVIPAENSKNGKPHRIYLSDFTVAQFEQVKEISKETPWCYPNAKKTGPVCSKTVTKQTGDRQRQPGQKIMSNRSAAPHALLLPGGKWTPHDLRRTGATMMTALGVIPEVAERCLNHTEENKVKRIYQRHSYSNEMKEAWQRLGEKLNELIAPNHDFAPTNPSIQELTPSRDNGA